jgi:ArsR family transcriptional regulator
MNEFNVSTDLLSQAFALLGQPSRLNLFLAIGDEHVCVCHLEAVLGHRQAYISQQLMVLRAAGMVQSERCGRHIFYSISDPRWLDLIKQAARLKGVELPRFDLPEIEDCKYCCKSSK